MFLISSAVVRVTVLLIAFVAVPVALASQDDKEALAKQLLEVTDTKQLLDQSIPQMEAIMKSAVPEDLPPEKAPILEKYHARFLGLMREGMSWEKLEPQFVELYARVFTASELEEMVAFYRSPLGQKMMKKMPELMQESMLMTQRQMKELMPKMRVLINEMKQELCCSE